MSPSLRLEVLSINWGAYRNVEKLNPLSEGAKGINLQQHAQLAEQNTNEISGTQHTMDLIGFNDFVHCCQITTHFLKKHNKNTSFSK